MKQKVKELSELVDELVEEKNNLVRYEHYSKNSEEGSSNEWYNKVKIQKIECEIREVLKKINILFDNK